MNNEDLKISEEETTESTIVEPTNSEENITEEDNTDETPIDIATIKKLLKEVRNMVEMMEQVWMASKNEFKITEEQMQKLFAFNKQYHIPHEASSEEVDINGDDYIWNSFNGLHNLTVDDVVDIFGENHLIIGIYHTVTMDRIRSIIQDCVAWIRAMKEYKNIYDSFITLVEDEETESINKLKEAFNASNDPVNKELIGKHIDKYYYLKHLDFITEPIDPDTEKHIIKSFSSESKLQFLIDRSTSKLDKFGISKKFILEISQIEKRFLEEKYHIQNNIFLIYFMNFLVYSNLEDADTKAKVMALLFGLDKFVRDQHTPEMKEIILNNMIKFQESFIGKLPLDVTSKYEKLKSKNN